MLSIKEEGNMILMPRVYALSTTASCVHDILHYVTVYVTPALIRDCDALLVVSENDALK